MNMMLVTWPRWPPRPYMIKNLQKSSSPEPVDRFPLNLVCSIGDSEIITLFETNPRLHQFAIWAATWKNQQCGIWLGLTQTRLYSHWRWLEAWNFGFIYYPSSENKGADQLRLPRSWLICVFVFAYAKRWFSHEAAHMLGVNGITFVRRRSREVYFL